MTEYQCHGSHDIRLRLVDDRQHKVARASSVMFAEIQLVNVDMDRYRNGHSDIPIVRMKTFSGSEREGEVKDSALIIRRFESSESITVVTSGTSTELRLCYQADQDAMAWKTITMSFEIINAVHSLEQRRQSRKSTGLMTRLIEDRAPFVLQEVALAIEPLVGDDYIAAQLDYPYSIAPRCRQVRNLDFNSLTSGVGLDAQRQFVFVRKELSLAMVISSDDDFELSAPAVPFFLASFGFLAMALTVKIFPEGFGQSNNSDSLRIAVGQVVIGLALATSYVGIFRRRRLFFPSAQFGRLPAESWSLLVSVPTVIVAEIMLLLQFTGRSVWPFRMIEMSSNLLFFVAVIYALFALAYFIMLQMGKLQYLLCDECGARTPVHPWSGSGVWSETGEYLCRSHLRRRQGLS